MSVEVRPGIAQDTLVVGCTMRSSAAAQMDTNGKAIDVGRQVSMLRSDGFLSDGTRTLSRFLAETPCLQLPPKEA